MEEERPELVRDTAGDLGTGQEGHPEMTAFAVGVTTMVWTPGRAEMMAELFLDLV